MHMSREAKTLPLGAVLALLCHLEVSSCAGGRGKEHYLSKSVLAPNSNLNMEKVVTCQVRPNAFPVHNRLFRLDCGLLPA
eukprot:1150312-Pelagomonas_calceolata.AAC.2